MKTNIFLLIIVSALFSSCSQDEEMNTVSEKIREIELRNPESKREGTQYKCPLAVATLSPCGYGFNVSVTFAGSPIVGSYPYTIRDLGGTLIDSGVISDGMNTPWVLAGCQVYEFEFWGSWCSSSSAIQIMTTDGCGGAFLCWKATSHLKHVEIGKCTRIAQRKGDYYNLVENQWKLI